MDTWRGPLDGWQDLLEVWGFFATFAILSLGASERLGANPPRRRCTRSTPVGEATPGLHLADQNGDPAGNR
jgi:hypothetical protein